MSQPAYPVWWQRLRYTAGGRLPQYRPWVWHDLTSYGWRGRVVLRVLAQVTPFALLLALLPGPAYLHLALPLLVVLGALFTAAAYAEGLRDRRLRQHGLPPVE